MFRLTKKSYHQFSLNNLMKIESLEFKFYFDVFFSFGFFFFAILAKYFHDARLLPQIRSGPVVLTKSIIFSGNSILFLDFSYLLSIFFLLDDAFASPAPVVAMGCDVITSNSICYFVRPGTFKCPGSVCVLVRSV